MLDNYATSTSNPSTSHPSKNDLFFVQTSEASLPTPETSPTYLFPTEPSASPAPHTFPVSTASARTLTSPPVSPTHVLPPSLNSNVLPEFRFEPNTSIFLHPFPSTQPLDLIPNPFSLNLIQPNVGSIGEVDGENDDINVISQGFRVLSTSVSDSTPSANFGNNALSHRSVPEPSANEADTRPSNFSKNSIFDTPPSPSVPSPFVASHDNAFLMSPPHKIFTSLPASATSLSFGTAPSTGSPYSVTHSKHLLFQRPTTPEAATMEPMLKKSKSVPAIQLRAVTNSCTSTSTPATMPSPSPSPASSPLPSAPPLVSPHITRPAPTYRRRTSSYHDGPTQLNDFFVSYLPLSKNCLGIGLTSKVYAGELYISVPPPPPTATPCASPLSRASHMFTSDLKYLRPCAVKVMQEDDASQMAGLMEAYLLKQCHQHPNIVTIFDVMDTVLRPAAPEGWIRVNLHHLAKPHPRLLRTSYLHPFLDTPIEQIPRPSYALVLEKCEKSLWRHWKTTSHPSPRALLGWFKQIVSALAYLHGLGIVHHDLKPHNIYLDKHGQVKLGDFGASRQVSKHSEGYFTDGVGRGTTTYLAPELVQDHPYTAAIDIYSLGVTFFVLSMLNKDPFPNLTSTVHIFLAIQRGFLNYPFHRDVFESQLFTGRAHHCHPEFIELLRSCLEVNPELRPTAKELQLQLQNLPWIAQ